MKPEKGEKKRKLKILISLLYYYPHTTGLTFHVQLVAEELARRGHQVTVLTSRHEKGLPRGAATHNGLRIVRIWAPIRVSRGMILPTYPWHLLRLARQHDIVCIHTPMLETAMASVLAGLVGRNVVPTHHGDLYLPEGLVNTIIIKIMYALFAFMARRAPRIITYSEDYRQNSYYLKSFREKVEAVYPPVSIPEPNPDNVRLLKEKWRCGDGPILGFAGRFAYEKRPDLLIKALEIINRKHPNARVVFAGENRINYENTWNVQKALIEKYQSQLIFLGLLRDRRDIADFYAACDVLVQPSNNEALGLTQVEAMLCGTPVVMTDIYGGRVAVQVTGMGKLAKSGDWKSIGEAVLDVLENRERYVKPKEFIMRCFSFKKTVDRNEEIYTMYARKENAPRHSDY